MLLGIRPTVDFVFKRVYGNVRRPKVTCHFVNAVICEAPLTPPITRVTLQNTVFDKDSVDDKAFILDILGEDDFGRFSNIEVQTTLPFALVKRLTYYACVLYTNRLGAGQNYGSLKGTVCICVLEKSLFPESPHLHLDFRLRDVDGLVFNEDLQIQLIQLPNLRRDRHNIQEGTPLEKWAFFLTNAEKCRRTNYANCFPSRSITKR